MMKGNGRYVIQHTLIPQLLGQLTKLHVPRSCTLSFLAELVLRHDHHLKPADLLIEIRSTHATKIVYLPEDSSQQCDLMHLVRFLCNRHHCRLLAREMAHGLK